MRENNKVYGFVMAMYEYLLTIETLWDSTKDFIKRNPKYLAPDNSLDFFVDNSSPSKEGDAEIKGDYNLCHFWSNFEIADMDFWRSPAYSDYFSYLDSLGGFFYEVFKMSHVVIWLILIILAMGRCASSFSSCGTISTQVRCSPFWRYWLQVSGRLKSFSLDYNFNYSLDTCRMLDVPRIPNRMSLADVFVQKTTILMTMAIHASLDGGRLQAGISEQDPSRNSKLPLKLAYFLAQLL